MFKKLLFISLLVIGIAVCGQEPEKKISVEPVKLTDNIYAFKGTKSNSAILVGNDGILLIDSTDKKDFAEELKRIIEGISKQPIRYLVNTHWHFDHTSGNEFFGSNGVTIIGHAEMSRRAGTQKSSRGEPPVPKIGLPSITYKNEMTIHLNGEDVMLVHPTADKAHTDGDTVVYFKKANVVHTGDLYFEGLYPYIDVDAGGWINGMIAADQEILKNIDDRTIVIPGHGPVSDKKKLEAFVAMLSDISAKVTKMIEEGKSLEEVKALKPTAAYDEVWGKGFLNPDRFTEMVYNGLKRNLKK